MTRLVRVVFVRDPAKHRDILLRAGEEPAPEYAALVTNPACWEDGKLPTAAKKTAQEQSEPNAAPAGGEGEGAKQATAKKAAARTPARGRKSAADEGSSS